MSELRYGPPVPTTAPANTPTPRPAAWRTVVTVMATLLGPPAALVAGFVALITWSGCFIGCEAGGADHQNGSLLGVLAVLLLLAGPLLAGLLLKRWSAVGFAVLGVVGVLGAIALTTIR